MKRLRVLLPLSVAVLGAAWSCSAPPARPASPSSASTTAPATASSSAAGGDALSPQAASIASLLGSDSVTLAPIPLASTSASVSASASASAPPAVTIGAGTRVFLFGDSMVIAGLGQRMDKLVTARGGKYADNHWSSSTTKTWSESERLPNLLFKNKPDVVFIAIGSNEVYFLDKNAGEHVKTIVKKLGGRPCVWIGPPVWKKQTGIVEAERDNASPCAFFDSSSLQLDRQPDGIHPSLKGGAQWAEAVWAATVAP